MMERQDMPIVLKGPSNATPEKCMAEKGQGESSNKLLSIVQLTEGESSVTPMEEESEGDETNNMWVEVLGRKHTP
eukprot:c35194_g1_i1 orf=50-274(-)